MQVSYLPVPLLVGRVKYCASGTQEIYPRYENTSTNVGLSSVLPFLFLYSYHIVSVLLHIEVNLCLYKNVYTY